MIIAYGLLTISTIVVLAGSYMITTNSIKPTEFAWNRYLLAYLIMLCSMQYIWG